MLGNILYLMTLVHFFTSYDTSLTFPVNQAGDYSFILFAFLRNWHSSKILSISNLIDCSYGKQRIYLNLIQRIVVFPSYMSFKRIMFLSGSLRGKKLASNKHFPLKEADSNLCERNAKMKLKFFMGLWKSRGCGTQGLTPLCICFQNDKSCLGLCSGFFYFKFQLKFTVELDSEFSDFLGIN